MADTPEILKRARLPAATRVMALVPNARGLSLALEAGVREVNWVLSVTESHNRSNVNRSVEESLRDFAAAWGGLGTRQAAAAAQPLHLLRLPLGGARAGGVRGALRGAGDRRRARGGDRHLRYHRPRGAPTTSARCFARLLASYAGERVRFAFHGHDTYGLGVANALEA